MWRFGEASAPSAAATLQVKRWVAEILALDPDTVITVAQLACRESHCAPLETAIGVHLPGHARCYSIHKPVVDVTRDDVLQVLQAPPGTPTEA